jgi:general secretion pathway protein G
MKKLLLPLIGILTFSAGIACADSYRAAISHYQTTRLVERETKLHSELLQMRNLIAQYTADKGTLPHSLDELVETGYLRNIPVDPITGQKDWQVTVDWSGVAVIVTVFDVHSTSAAVSSEGTTYSEW